jgi:hypothetical protein
MAKGSRTTATASTSVTETTAVTDRTIVASPHDLIRVVPLFVPEALTKDTAEAAAAVAATPPKLTYRNGPMLSSVQVFMVFWGAAWQSGAPQQLAGSLNQFFDDILTSSLMDQLAEYNTGSFKVGHGKRVGTTTIATPQVRRSITDSAIQHWLQHEIATNSAFPPASPNTLYFIFLPPGVSVVQGGGKSCHVFCGYHDQINGQIFYAVMPYANCQGCLGNLSALDALTSTSSHELSEAITDAIPGQGWYDDNHGEIGDICAWQTKKIGNHVVQLEWSNQAGKCI